MKDRVVTMKYIHFVCICSVIILGLCGSAFSASDQRSMIYNAEYTLNMNQIVFLEQNYTFKIVDANDRSGDILVKVYHKDKEVDIDAPFGDEKKPFKYTVTIPETNEKKTDYTVLKITPLKFDVKDNIIKVKVKVEQFIDPKLQDKDFLILDATKSLKVGENISLNQGYLLRADNLNDKKITLQLIRNNTILKSQELKPEDVFCYCKNTSGIPRTIFITKINDYFESSSGTTVFLKGVTQRYDANPTIPVKSSIKSNATLNNSTKPIETNNGNISSFRSLPFICLLFLIVISIGAYYLFMKRRYK